MPQVSIIIPTYNYGKYIKKAIDSILNQTVQDFEIIVVDDGSTDNTKKIIYLNYKDRVKYFFQKHLGAPAARNRGIEESTGKYLVFLDADDWFMPEAVASRCNFLNQNPNYGWVYGPCVYHNEAAEDISSTFQNRSFAYKHSRAGYILNNLLLGELIHTPTVMIQRTLVQEAGNFKADLPCLQDYELWLRVAALSPIGFIRDCNVVVVSHEGSISRSRSDGYKTWLQILRDAENRYPNAIKKLEHRWKKRIAYILAERGRHLAALGDLPGGISLLKEAIQKNPWHFRHYAGYIKAVLG